MKKIKNTVYSAILSLTLMAACKKDEVSSFSANPAINFVTTAVEYSFMVNPNPEYIQTIEVNIIGNAADHDRKFNVVAVNDANTTATTSQFEIIGGLVKAGQFKGTLSIKLKNSAELSTKKVTLKVKLVESEDFKVGNVENSSFTIGWTNQILVPNPWSYFQYFFTTRGSTAAYRIILQTTGVTRFILADYRLVGEAGAIALGTKFGDYVKQWNKDHPNDHLKHDDGTLIGQEIVPLYYTHSKFD